MPIVAAPQDATAATGLSGTTSVISAGWRGQGMGAARLSCFSFTREGKQPAPYPAEVGWRWEGCSSLHLPRERKKRCRGIWGKTASIHEGLRFLLDLHPTETKCQYCWTYLAPPKVQSYSEQCLSKNSDARLLVYCVFLLPNLNISV